MHEQRASKVNLPLHLLLATIVLACAALEGWFGRPELFGDDISYLDVANMIRLGDWKDALNPLWSIGYPLLLTAVRPIFPSGIHGELTAVFALNLAICLVTWLTFVWFLSTAVQFIPQKLEVAPGVSPFLATLAACVFLVAEIGYGRVSSIGPDQLVACLFFAASALLLRLLKKSETSTAVAIGITLGVGYIVKAIFLPLAVIVIATALLVLRRKRPRRPLLILSPVFLVFVVAYGAALSWSLGRLSFGESGPLNYAYHVDQLPHWMGWQGGPPRLGTPLHPVHLLRDNPAVFGFGEPFHVTYPPQFNLHYWYDGYTGFISPRNTVRAVAVNLHELEKVFHENWPFTLAIVVALFLIISGMPRRSRTLQWMGTRILPLWPIYLPSIFGIALYLQVHLEARYIAPFVAILTLLPFLTFDSLRFRKACLLLVIAGTVADLTLQLRPSALRAIHRADMLYGGQWTIADYLTKSGLRPGDKVATVTTGNNIRCTWAYAAGLHVIASIGNDAYNPQDQQQDFNLFWTDPVTQQDVLRLFREQGAVAVVVPFAAKPPIPGHWNAIPSTNAWLLHL